MMQVIVANCEGHAIELAEDAHRDFPTASVLIQRIALPHPTGIGITFLVFVFTLEDEHVHVVTCPCQDPEEEDWMKSLQSNPNTDGDPRWN